MKAKDRIKEQLINELARTRQRIAELEASETDRKRAERAVQEAREYAENVVDTVREPLVVLDADLRVLLANRSFCQTFKVTPEETQGQLIYDLGNRQWDIPRLRELLEKILPENTTLEDFEVENEFPTIGPRIMLLNARRIYREGNKTQMILLAVEDITKRKRAEEALRDSEEMSRGIIESAATGIYVLQGGKFQYVSPLFEQIGGYTGDELIGTYSLDHIHPEDREMVRNKAIEELKGQSSSPHEFRFIRKDGKTIWGLEKVASIQYKGERAVIGAFMDITERKEMEERLVRSEKLAVLGQLGGGVGHELRNPLGAIKNAVYFLNMALEEPEPDVKETLEILDKEVATSERIISSLLDFARAKPPTRGKVDINDVIQEALSGTTVPENVQVVSQLGEALPTIMADPHQLVQVFGNIILNAVQAMPDGGQLVIESGAPGQGWVAVSVADTGVGIPEENLGRLFEPLFTTKAKGIGLGLAVVKAMVEGHGGSIVVQSEVGRGTTFTVRLPLGLRKEDWRGGEGQHPGRR